MPLRQYTKTVIVIDPSVLVVALADDAAYVALAEAAEAVLLTADARLSHTTGPRCAIEVLDD
jgi:hypothetical protein